MTNKPAFSVFSSLPENERLIELNLGACQAPDLLCDDMLRVIWELFDPEDFEERKMEREPALEEINPALSSIRAESLLRRSPLA